MNGTNIADSRQFVVSFREHSFARLLKMIASVQSSCQSHALIRHAGAGAQRRDLESETMEAKEKKLSAKLCVDEIINVSSLPRPLPPTPCRSPDHFFEDFLVVFLVGAKGGNVGNTAYFGLKFFLRTAHGFRWTAQHALILWCAFGTFPNLVRILSLSHSGMQHAVANRKVSAGHLAQLPVRSSSSLMIILRTWATALPNALDGFSFQQMCTGCTILLPSRQRRLFMSVSTGRTREAKKLTLYCLASALRVASSFASYAFFNWHREAGQSFLTDFLAAVTAVGVVATAMAVATKTIATTSRTIRPSFILEK